MVKRWRVKWDETEVPDGEYVRASDYDRLEAALRKIVSDGDYTAPEGMKRIAMEALRSESDADSPKEAT